MFRDFLYNFEKTVHHRNSKIILGPSSLESVANEEFSLDSVDLIFIPNNLLRLFEKIKDGSTEHRDFLIKIFKYYRRRPSSSYLRLGNEYYQFMVDRLIEIISYYDEEKKIIWIQEEEVLNEVKESLNEFSPGIYFEISLSPISNFMRDYMEMAYSLSLKCQVMIIEKTRKIFTDIGHHVVTLQIPDRLDGLYTAKSRFTGRMWRFRGGKAAKFFFRVCSFICRIN